MSAKSYGQPKCPRCRIGSGCLAHKPDEKIMGRMWKRRRWKAIDRLNAEMDAELGRRLELEDYKGA